MILPSLISQVQNSQGLGVFPGLDDDGPVHHFGLEDFGVGMASDDDVDPWNPGGQFPVRLVAAMRQDHDDIGLGLEFREIFFHRNLRGGEGEPHDIPGMGGHGGVLGDHPDDPDPDPRKLFHHIGLEGRQTLDVGPQDGKAGLGDPFLQHLEAKIELVVAHHHGVELHGVHHVDGGFALEEVGPGVPLDHVSGRQQQRRTAPAGLVHGPRQVGDAAQGGPGAGRLIRFGKAVKIIDIEDPQS